MAKDDFFIINSWMIDDLGLSGIELLCFAIIWSLSRGDRQMYIAGNSYLVKMTKKTEQTIIATLKKLCAKGLIEKVPVTVGNVERNYYKAIGMDLNNLSEGLKNLSGTTKKILAPNIESNNKRNNKEKRLSNDNQKVDFSFEVFWPKYRKGSKQQALKEWEKLKDSEKDTVLKTFENYIKYCRRSNRAVKDCSTFLHQKCFNEDWNIIPDFYLPNEHDSERLAKFKSWMCSDYPDLIYHRNPLTFEQASDLFDTYSVKEVKLALCRLCERDVHQYFSIKSGVEKILTTEDIAV